MDFLDPNYKVPEKPSPYMKFHQGENRFRILSKAITGYEGWTQATGGKPIRKRPGVTFTTNEVDPSTIKHFWAFFVWNFELSKVQVLQLTQTSLMKPIASLTKNKAWGDPTKYTIIVDKSGEKLETEYVVNPEPPTALDEEATKAWEAIKDKVNLEALYDAGDPFGDKLTSSDEIDLENIKF